MEFSGYTAVLLMRI